MASPAPTAPPDPKPAGLIPVAKIQFLPGMNLDCPGLAQTNGCTSQDPSTSAFRRVFFDARSQRFIIMAFAPGADLGRAPTAIKEYPAAICISERAL
jgi:hypothetical protein